MALLKDTTKPPRVQDVLQFEWFVEDFLNLGHEIIRDLDRNPEDTYRQCVEDRRDELREVCGALLNKLHGTQSREAPRTVLFALPLEARA